MLDAGVGCRSPFPKSLEELAAAGNVEMVCRIAGQARMVLRGSDHSGEHRFNACCTVSPGVT